MSEVSVRLQDEVSVCSDRNVQADFSDLSLIQAVAKNDKQAFLQLIDIHGEEIARLIGRLTAWHNDSDDILQDVLLLVWQRADSFSGKGSLIGWMKRIAINRCRNHFRRLEAVRRKLREFADSLIVGPKRHYESSFEGTELNPELNAAMQKLSQTDRSLLVLFYVEEWDGAEIADSLGIRNATLHVRLHRARKKLKKYLENGD